MALTDTLRGLLDQVEGMEQERAMQEKQIVNQAKTIREQEQQIAVQDEIIQRQAAIVAEQDQIIELYGKLADRIDDYRAKSQEEPFPFPPNAPAPAEQPDEKPASNFAKRYTDEMVAEWYQLAQSGATMQEIADEYDTTSTTVRKRLAKFTPPETTPEPEPEPAVDPILAAIDAYGKPAEPEGMSLQERVDRWAAALGRNLTAAEIARNFHANPRDVEEALQARGLICECGTVIGRENPGILRGHDGVCGYCLQDKLGVKSVSAII